MQMMGRIPVQLPAGASTFVRACALPRGTKAPTAPLLRAFSSQQNDGATDAARGSGAPSGARRPMFRRPTPSRQRQHGGGGTAADDLKGRNPSNDIQEMAQLFDALSPSERSQLDGLQDRAELSMRSESLQSMDDAELRARAKSISKYDSLSYLEQTLMEPLALDAIREQLSTEDAALLGKLLVKDESSADIGTGLRQSSVGRQLLKLKLPERKRLRGLLSRMQALAEQFEMMGEMKDYMDEKLSIRMRRRASQKGLVTTEEAGQEWEFDDETGEGAGGEDAADQMEDAFQTPMSADRINSSSGSSSSSSNSNSQRTWGSSFVTSRFSGSQKSGTRASQGQARVPPADPSDPAEQIAQLMSDVTQRYVLGDGWQEELEGSKDLQRLKRLVAKLTTLADLSVQGLDGTDLTPYQFMQELKAAVQEVDLMAATGPQSQDSVVRDSVEFMTQHLVTRDDAGVEELQFEPKTIARLAQFVKAAEVWQQYQPFLLNAMEQQDSLGLEGPDESTPAMLAALAEHPKWWLKDDDTRHGSGSTARQDASRGRPAASPGAVVEIDEEKIAALASADPLVLRFLTDLLGNGFSEEVLIKYSMHPTLGPKLRSGDWLTSMPMDGMPELVKQSWEQALQQ